MIMKELRYSFLLVAFLLAIAASAQMRWNSAYQTYINQYKDLAVSP